MNVKNIARFGVLAAVALVLGYFERYIPVVPGIPGIKLGLANTVLLYAVFLMDIKSSAALMLTKVLLSGLLFQGLSGLMYSLAGGVLSLAVMLAVKQIRGTGTIGVSVAGAVAHNVGQFIVACLVVGARAVTAWLPVLLISGLAAGLLTGIVAKYSINASE